MVKINEYGLMDNYPKEGSTFWFIDKLSIAVKNLGRFLYYNANDGAFDDLDEAETEALNIMRGEFYINIED
tara:strand:- start:1643 stop:1855 length:213 start_codon:yes stop_codon:yes gene_type:complete